MANYTTTTSANDLVDAAELVADAILPHFYGHNTAMHLVRQESIASYPGTAKNFPTVNALAAASVSEGADMAASQFSTGVETITVGEVGLLLVLTDLLSVSDIVTDDFYTGEAGKAMSKKLTTDVLSLSSGFSNSVGSTGVDITESEILEGIQTLMANGVDGPYHGVLHPRQYIDLVGDIGTTITPAANSSESSRAVSNEFGARPDGALGTLYGVNWSISNLVPTANSGADRLGMIVSPNYAIGLVWKWMVRVEPERDASLRAREIAITAAYGTGELLDSAGVGVLGDA